MMGVYGFDVGVNKLSPSSMESLDPWGVWEGCEVGQSCAVVCGVGTEAVSCPMLHQGGEAGSQSLLKCYSACWCGCTLVLMHSHAGLRPQTSEPRGSV